MNTGVAVKREGKLARLKAPKRVPVSKAEEIPRKFRRIYIISRKRNDKVIGCAHNLRAVTQVVIQELKTVKLSQAQVERLCESLGLVLSQLRKGVL